MVWEEPWQAADRYWGRLDAEQDRWPTCDICGAPIPPEEEFYQFPEPSSATSRVCQGCLPKYLTDRGYATYWEE